MTGQEEHGARPETGLNAFASNVTSQGGEDGILAEVFRRIGAPQRYCVEFGAWNGEYLSNAWSFWHEQGWAALLIEGDERRCEALAASIEPFEGVRAVQRWVSPSGGDRLDAILREVGAPHDFDLLSIDIDGDDYYIFESLSSFRPRCVIVEHNPTIPPDIDVVQGPGEYFGASARALLRLAHEKDYRLCACTSTNSIFVDAAVFDSLGVPEPALEDVFPRDGLIYMISAYDGALMLNQVPCYLHRIKHPRRLRLRPPGPAHPKLAGPDGLIRVEVALSVSEPEAAGRPTGRAEGEQTER